MDTATPGFFSISPAKLTAYAAVLFLCGVVGWNMTATPPALSDDIQTPVTKEDQNNDYLAALATDDTAATSTGITQLGASIVAQAILAYDHAAETASSTEAGLVAVKTFGANIIPQVNYRTYAASDIITVADTSHDRVLAYRADLRVALEPLLENKTYELDIYGSYVESRDQQYLKELQVVANNYRAAITRTEKVVAPADAAIFQASVLTSLSKFAATLDAMIINATDPFASSALLRTFLEAQDGLLASFNSVAKYALQKTI